MSPIHIYNERKHSYLKKMKICNSTRNEPKLGNKINEVSLNGRINITIPAHSNHHIDSAICK